jgi:hypothetical protein
MGLTAMQAGLAVGAGSYLLNPKAGLMGGLSAGLGGYGGAGLGAGLGNLGATSEAGLTSGVNANEAIDAQMKQMEAARAEAIKQQVIEKNAAMDSLTGRTDLTPAQIDTAYKPQPQLQPYTADEMAQNRVNAMNEYQATAPAAKPQSLESMTPDQRFSSMNKGLSALVSNPSAENIKQLGGGSYTGLAQMGLAAAAPAAPALGKVNGLPVTSTVAKQQSVPHYRFSPGMVTPTPAAGATGVENTYFKPSYTALSDEEAANLYPGYPAARAADGGLMAFGAGGEADSYKTTLDDSLEEAYAKAQEKNDTATMREIEKEMEIRNTNKAGMTKGLSGMQGLAMGGLSDAHYNLGGYSDGGRLLRGPGDGVSDSIPAVIGKKQPARLADGEFVVPARIVSEIGNGSTEAGARKLYAMMDRIQAARGKTVGKGKVAKNTRADKYLPA